jgi:hypothetical protein
MSTKTTFKRVALVAVASLGLSLVAVAPTNAAVNSQALYHSTNPAASNYADNSSITQRILLTASAVIGIQHSFVASQAGDTATVTATLDVNVSNYYNGQNNPNSALPVLAVGAYATHNTGAAVNANQAVDQVAGTVSTGSVAAGAVVGSFTSTFTPTQVGTYTLSYKITGETFTQTVIVYATQAELDTANGVDNAISATGTTSFLNTGETSTATVDATVSASMALGTDAVATIVVTPKNAAGTTIANVTFPITATISGPGSLRVSDSVANATASPAGRAVTGTTGHYFIGVFSDGTAGPATITISSGTTVLATEKVTFYGAVASYSATVAKNVIPMAATTTGVVAVVAKDKDGNVVPSQTVHIKASDATVVANYTGTSASASEAAAGTATIQVIGIAGKFGKLTLTIGNADVATITTTAVVTLSSTTAAAAGVKLAFDKAEYTAGEKITLKATAVDANGLPVAPMDPISGTPTSNTSLFGFPTTWDTTTTDGSVSYTFYAPLVPGPITVTGTDSNGAAISASATVISDGIAQAAVDAASEAIDAANAATDAANAAAEAADAATAAAQDAADAVAALSVSVAAMIDALKKQITSLTNLVIKIQKKVKA